ncbi:MAG TPA: glycoside hydrolase family 97 N-terminal domain-containing protein [Puia sp.]|nr:glycoside hydrolase family 97 N-terminal domain-containing protein [Puia sp.]
MKTRLLLLATLCIVQLLPAVAASGHTASALSARTVDPAAPAAGAILIKSPDGHLVFQLSPGNKDLLFTILSGNSPVISASPLRFSLDGTPLTENTQIAGVRRYQVREKCPWLGVHATAINECVPGADSAASVPDEGTVFTLPGKAILWYHDINGHYEGVHEKKELQQVRTEEWVAPPATLKLPQGLYVAVTEAELQAYSGIVLQADGKSGLVLRMAHRQPPSHPYVLRYSPEDVARLSQPTVIRGTITTPWHLPDLCPPPDPTLFPQGIHTDWIRPGRAVWKYLDGGGDGTPETMKKFTDEAAALGFEYNILEGFWTKWTDAQLKDLVDYSRQKGVGIWIWQHSKSLRDPASLQKAEATFTAADTIELDLEAGGGYLALIKN